MIKPMTNSAFRATRDAPVGSIWIWLFGMIGAFCMVERKRKMGPAALECLAQYLL